MQSHEIQERIGALQIGPPVTFRNLSIIALTCPDSAESPRYLLLDEAIDLGALLISEISADGSVPDLQVTNSADRPVLILDGEELIGAKQNRVLNLSVLVPAHSTMRVPVSCVEAGRWTYESPSFRSAPHAQYAKGRAARAAHVTESLRSSGERRSNQVDVWADLEEKASRLGTHSATGAMMAMYLDHAPQIEEYAQAFHPGVQQCGAVFAINGQVQGVDLFDHSHTLRTALPKLVRGYALDAIDGPRSEPVEASADAAAEFLKIVGAADAIKVAALGIGADLRIESDDAAGGALSVDGSLVHLFAFRRARRGSEAASRFSARMSRPSRRGQRPTSN
jgi:hypothetical protein